MSLVMPFLAVSAVQAHATGNSNQMILVNRPMPLEGQTSSCKSDGLEYSCKE